MRVALSALLLVLSTPCRADMIVGRASVIDGDTIEIRGQRIRLFGIDAPEGGQTCKDARGRTYRCGQRAAQALDYRISGSAVYCDPQDTDRYGRVVAICQAWGEDLNAWMVGLGWALAIGHTACAMSQPRISLGRATPACGRASSCRLGNGGGLTETHRGAIPYASFRGRSGPQQSNPSRAWAPRA
jgi:endonuclease YncB( thermonuclease family)